MVNALVLAGQLIFRLAPIILRLTGLIFVSHLLQLTYFIDISSYKVFSYHIIEKFL